MDSSEKKISDLLKLARDQREKKQTSKPTEVESSEKQAQQKLFEYHIQGLKDFYYLRKLWSWIIGLLLGITTLVIVVFIFLLGWSYLNYELYPWFPNTVIVSFFAQVVGLGTIVAMYLFSNPFFQKRK